MLIVERNTTNKTVSVKNESGTELYSLSNVRAVKEGDRLNVYYVGSGGTRMDIAFTLPYDSIVLVQADCAVFSELNDKTVSISVKPTGTTISETITNNGDNNASNIGD